MTQHQVSRHVTDAPDLTPCSMCAYHIGAGSLVAVVGLILMLTGGLAGIGVALLTIGVLYAVVAWVISMMPSKPNPERIP